MQMNDEYLMQSTQHKFETVGNTVNSSDSWRFEDLLCYDSVDLKRLLTILELYQKYISSYHNKVEYSKHNNTIR